MDSLATGNLSGIQKDELMEQVKQQIAVANAQELLTVINCIISHHSDSRSKDKSNFNPIIVEFFTENDREVF